MSNTSNKPTQPQFFELNDEKMVVKILDLVHRNKLQVTVWTKNQGIKLQSLLVNHTSQTNLITFQITESVDEGKFVEALKEQKSTLIMGSFQLNTVNFFFRAQLNQILDDKQFRLEAPKSLFKFQRRQNLRIPFEWRTAPKAKVLLPNLLPTAANIKIPGNVLELPLLDLSVGGLALAMTTPSKEVFSANSELNSIEFILRGEEIAISGIITHTSTFKDDKGVELLKVGVRFLNIKGIAERKISQFVVDESRKYFTALAL